MAKVRTRFAPSPTGYMHIGNLRTALYEYLIAKHDHGDFILRIEDTDQEREVEGAVDMIYKVMDQTGLGYDEGPNKPGGVHYLFYQLVVLLHLKYSIEKKNYCHYLQSLLN